MGKRGPKAKKGVTRTPSGRASRSKSTMQMLNEMNARKERDVLDFVANQPHRRGDDSKMAECPLGRFCKEYGLDDAVYQAALNYNDIRRRWRSAMGAPTNLRLNMPAMIGDGPSFDTVQGWAHRLASLRHAVVDAVGGSAWLAAETLIVDEIEIPEVLHTPARNALAVLAVEMGAIKKDRRVFA